MFYTSSYRTTKQGNRRGRGRNFSEGIRQVYNSTRLQNLIVKWVLIKMNQCFCCVHCLITTNELFMYMRKWILILSEKNYFHLKQINSTNINDINEVFFKLLLIIKKNIWNIINNNYFKWEKNNNLYDIFLQILAWTVFLYLFSRWSLKVHMHQFSVSF